VRICPRAAGDPGFVEAWFNLGCVAAGRGRPDAARRSLEQAVARDPDYADAVYNLGSLAFEAGDLPAAGRWWTRYLELDPESEWGLRAAAGLRYFGLASPAPGFLETSQTAYLSRRRCRDG
jgi:tetratricopeptide (TPR) repeat protein